MSLRGDKAALTVRECAVFAMLGALMFSSKVIMDALPNIHLIGMLVGLCTAAFRAKALFPIYIFVFLTGLYGGFALWWIPYIYVWTILWGAFMLIPKNISDRWKMIIYPTLCALHGLLYGTLYAPAQALLFGLDFDGMIAWIIAGIPFDIIHGISNIFTGLLILPLSKTVAKIRGR